MRSSVSATGRHALEAALGGGVVPAAALTLAPTAPMSAGTLRWPSEHSHRVLHEWRAWATRAPGDVTSVARIVRAPHLAGVERSLRGRAVVSVDVAIAGEPAVAAGRLTALRRLEPELDTVAPVSARELLARSAPAGGTRAIGEQLVLRALPAAAVDAFVAAAGPGSRSELVAAELRPLDDEEVAVVALGIAADADQAARVRIELKQLARRLAPWTAG